MSAPREKETSSSAASPWRRTASSAYVVGGVCWLTERCGRVVGSQPILLILNSTTLTLIHIHTQPHTRTIAHRSGSSARTHPRGRPSASPAANAALAKSSTVPSNVTTRPWARVIWVGC